MVATPATSNARIVVLFINHNNDDGTTSSPKLSLITKTRKQRTGTADRKKTPMATYYVSRFETTTHGRVGRALPDAVRVLDPSEADLIWLNTPVKGAEVVARDKCYNHVVGVSVLEHKGKLGMIQDLMTVPTLETIHLKEGFLPPGGDWVVKDPTANSGCGLWFMPKTRPQGSELIAQRYLRRPRLDKKGRKMQYRCYAVFQRGGRCSLYRKAMIQVCAKPYSEKDWDQRRVVTNVAVNEGDPDFEPERPERLSDDDFATIRHLVADLARAVGPFLVAPSPRHFEVAGLDIIFSEDLPYLIEVNCPPNNAGSSGVGPIEDFHSTFARDTLRKFFLNGSCPEWHLIYEPADDLPVSSFAAARLRHAARWKAFVQKRDDAMKAAFGDDDDDDDDDDGKMMMMMTPMPCSTTRHLFAFFQQSQDVAFLENAGGSQMPIVVRSAVAEAMDLRWRDVWGKERKVRARNAVGTFFDAENVIFGPNATSLFQSLATAKSGLRCCTCVESHSANINCWSECCQVSIHTETWPRCDVYAVPHAANVTGEVYDIDGIVRAIRRVNPEAFIVVDGVAFVPHRPFRFRTTDIDAYVVAFHKLFGPHLGACFLKDPTLIAERGTIDTDACAGITALLTRYFPESLGPDPFRTIRRFESPPFFRLLLFLDTAPNVRIVRTRRHSSSLDRLPTVAFSHVALDPHAIVAAAKHNRIAVRCGNFLAPTLLTHLQAPSIIVRASLAHYNTINDVIRFTSLLASLPGW